MAGLVLTLHDELGQQHLHGGREAGAAARLAEARRHVQHAEAVVLLVVVLLLALVQHAHQLLRQDFT